MGLVCGLLCVYGYRLSVLEVILMDFSFVGLGMCFGSGLLPGLHGFRGNLGLCGVALGWLWGGFWGACMVAWFWA